MNGDLAEICGILAGDCHLSRYISKKRTDYKVCVFGHKEDDKEYFLKVQKLFRKTIGVEPKLSIKKNCCELRIGSKKILEFFENLGIPVGKKVDDIKIPSKIKNNLQLSCSFLRGLADTDFSLVLKQRKTKKAYPRITTDLKSFQIIEDVCTVLNTIGIKHCGPYKRNRLRNGVPSTTYEVDINGHKNLDIWMKNIGFRNPKHLKKLEREDRTRSSL